MPTATRLMRGTRPTGPIMAERRFDSPSGRASIRIRAPARDASTGNYKCSVEWIHSREKELFELWGIDSMQALQLAMRAAGELANAYEGRLRWAGSDEGYLGFPKTYPEFLPKALQRKLERMIEREIATHTRKLEAEHTRRQRRQQKAERRTSARKGRSATA